MPSTELPETLLPTNIDGYAVPSGLLCEHDNDAFLDDDFLQTIYDSERRTLNGFLAESRLRQFPFHASHRLKEMTGITDHMQQLLELQNAEFIRLDRNTHGLRRTIACAMLGLSECHSPAQDIVGLDMSGLGVYLRDVLIPRWRNHLDDCVDHINYLIWFDKWAREGTCFEREHEEHMKDRKNRIQHMVKFALRRLQITKEEIAANMII